jgi:hypothetical protein
MASIKLSGEMAAQILFKEKTMKNSFFTKAGLLTVILVLGLVSAACDGTSLEKLLPNAAAAQVEITMDSMLASPECSEKNKARVEELKSLLQKNLSDDYWKEHSKSYITEINAMIPLELPVVERIMKNNDFLIPLTAALTLAVSLLLTVINGIFERNMRKKERKERTEKEKNELYLRLEFASIDFFKWEADKSDGLVEIRRKFQENWKTENSKDGETPKETMRRISQTILPQEEILLETWCTMQLNLFELIIDNTLEGVGRGDVFVTWLPWIFEAAHEAGFKQMWDGRLFAHYLGNCKKVIEYALHGPDTKESFVEKICTEYEKLNIDKTVLKDWIKL